MTRGTEDGVTRRGDSLATWKESTLLFRSSNRENTSSSQENQAVTLGWNNRITASDTTRHGPDASYTVELNGRLAARSALGRAH